MSEIKINQGNVTEAFKTAKGNALAINILTKLFGEQKPDYSDYHNIKTYEDACEALGIKPMTSLFIEYEACMKEEVIDIAHIAYIKLCTIAQAINNDKDFPRFVKDEYRYYPYFILYNQQEVDDMSDEDKSRLVFWGGLASCGASCGLAYAYSSYAWSAAFAHLGSRLAVSSSEQAIYFGNQFKELWKDYLIGRK